MKVIIVIGSLRGGGAERQVRYIVKSLVQNGDQLRICVMAQGSHPDHLDDTPITPLRSNSASWLKAFRKFRKISKGYEVVYSFMDLANVFTSLALIGSKVPHVWGLRSSGVAAGFVPNASFRLSKLLSTRATVAVGNSDAVLRFYQEAGFRPACWQVVTNGVDVSLFKPNRRDDLASDVVNDGSLKNLVVGMVARADAIKRHDIFFEMVASLKERFPEVSWLIAGLGTDSMNGAIIAQMEKSGVSQDITALGEVSAVADVVASLDIAVCCSDFEGSSNSILEAMASGVPVVSFNVGDAASMLENSGIIVSPARVELLAITIADLLNDPERRRSLGNAGRLAAKNQYSVEIMAAQTRKLLQASIDKTLGQRI